MRSSKWINSAARYVAERQDRIMNTTHAADAVDYAAAAAAGVLSEFAEGFEKR